MHQADGDVADSDAVKEPPHLPDPMLDDLRAAAASDTEYTELIAAIMDGFTVPRHQMAQGVRQFWKLREELSVDDGLVLIWPAYRHPEIGPSRTFTETPRRASGHRADEKTSASNSLLARYFQRHHSPGGELPELPGATPASAERAPNVRSSADKSF